MEPYVRDLNTKLDAVLAALARMESAGMVPAAKREAIIPTPAPVERLAMTAEEVCTAVGISETTRWRLEKRGLLMPIPDLGIKRYSVAAVRRFVERKKK